jgi:hypothetical protein
MSKRPRLEVADVVRAYGDEYRRTHPISAAQEKVLTHIAACRTAQLGGHVDECADGCGYARISYNSCRDRHCPKCQGPQRAQWLAARLERVLPTHHFHVVFTLPEQLRPLALRNPRTMFRLLFESGSRTLLELGRDDKRLGATIGLTAVLHTWRRDLQFHPHLHCIVTGGGLTEDGARWIAGRERYLFPVEVMGKLFRGKFLSGLRRAYDKGELTLKGATAELADPMAWSALKDRLYRQNWIVYAKRPFGGVKQVFEYLGRYTHRVAISNHRLLEMEGDRVTFTYRDSRRKCLSRMTLAAVEFLRRFLLHVLPGGFTRIRHYGLYAGRHVGGKLERARELLAPEAPSTPPPSPEPRSWWERFLELTGIDVMRCPRCKGRLIRTRRIDPQPGVFPFTPVEVYDSS